MLSRDCHQVINKKQVLDACRLAYTLNVQQERIHCLEEVNTVLGKDNSILKKTVSSLEQDKKTLEQLVLDLKERVALLTQEQFGKSSESHLDTVTPDDNQKDPDGDELVLIEAHQRKKPKKKKERGRRIDTSGLPRHRIVHDLDEDKRCCDGCGHDLKHIGESISEQIECIPQLIYVEEHVRPKYTCPDCTSIVMADKPLSPIPKGLAGARLITETILAKYQNHMPLYRQSKVLSSYGVDIPDNTLGNWLMTVGEGLLPLMNPLWEAMISSQYLQVDESPIKLLCQKKKGYIWCYVSPAKKIVIFELALSRSSEVVNTRLKDFQGVLQTDGYAGYTHQRQRKDITGISCLTHARRKFSDIVKSTQDKQGVAAQVIEQMKPLYALESMLREQKADHRTRKHFRQKVAWPIMKKLHRYLRMMRPRVPPKSALGKAISYSLNQWQYIIAYLRHGLAEIDTNLVENQIRPIALGRKNFLFMKDEKSGSKNALYFSLIGCCILNNINPRLYIHYLLTKIHDIRRGDIEISDLLPNTIDHKILEDFAGEQMRYVKETLKALKFPDDAQVDTSIAA
jgi:transposase